MRGQMVHGFLDILTYFGTSHFRSEEDFFDRLNSRYTTVIIIIFAVVISTKQYVGDPIACWAPSHFTKQQVEYTDYICWISNTYYVPINDEIPHPNEPRSLHNEISYYQWVPIILFLQASLFLLPNFFWHTFNDKAGVDVPGIVSLTTDIEGLNPEVREKTVKFLVRHMDRYLDIIRDYHRGKAASCIQRMAKYFVCIVGKRFGNRLVALYMVTKLLYIINVVSQIFMLNAFLGTEYNLYGFHVIGKLINGSDWQESPRFPRVTLCDFKVRALGKNIHRHTVQCTLPINLFNEKIFIFIWFWLVMVAAATTFSTLQWSFTFWRKNRLHFVRKYLKIFDKINVNTEQQLCIAFVEKYLRQDGAFILRLIWRNTNDVVTSEVVCALWEYFKKQRRDLHPQAHHREHVAPGQRHREIV